MAASMRDLEIFLGGFLFGVLACLALLAKVRRHGAAKTSAVSPESSPSEQVGHDRGIEIFDD